MNKPSTHSFIPHTSTSPQAALGTQKSLHLVQCIQDYVSKMISKPSGMKVLLLDKDTTSVVSCSCTQSFLLSQEVYLVDRLENKAKEKMSHLKCIVFVRPTAQSIALLCEELKAPKYGVYYLYFSNALKKSFIEKLAASDVYEQVKEVQECFADFLAVNHNLFSLDMQIPEWPIFSDTLSTWHPPSLQRTIEGLVGVLLSLKRKPLVRHWNAPLCQRLAQEVQHFVEVTEPGLFENKQTITLLILDRKDDAITPLLTPWTYQAMLHELLGIERGLIDLGHLDDIKQDMRQVVLSQEDPFYRANMYHNFGDLGFSIKSYLQEFQEKAHIQTNIESMADMKKFVDAYPEFKKLSGNVSKHVMLTGELSRIVETWQLLQTSEIEQNIACADRDQSEDILNLVNLPSVNEDCKLKLMLLYALRNRERALGNVFKTFRSSVSPFKANLVDLVLKYAKGEKMERSNTLPLKLDKNALVGLGKSMMKGLKGVENVYTQYTPPLVDILEQHVKGKLKESTYPYYLGNPEHFQATGDIIVFFIGGVTYEEARFAHQFQTTSPSSQIFLGGHTIHNSQSFLKQIHYTFTNQAQPPIK